LETVGLVFHLKLALGAVKLGQQFAGQATSTGQNGCMTENCGRLVLAGSPIGDYRDASARLIEALATADVIAAEDTRRLRQLCARLGTKPRGQVISYFDGNEVERAAQLTGQMLNGATVVLVTDAGMPGLSDPGYRLVRAAIEADLPVSVLPGPSAALTALVVSGLPTHRFCFEGFVPRKSGERTRYLEGLARETRTMVFFEAPHRLADFLDAAVLAFGADRPAAICRELTKPYEEVIRGPLFKLANWAKGEVRGEISLVIAGWVGLDEEEALATALAEVKRLLDQGAKTSQAVSQIAARLGLRRKTLYEAVLSQRGSEVEGDD